MAEQFLLTDQHGKDGFIIGNELNSDKMLRHFFSE